VFGPHLVANRRPHPDSVVDKRGEAAVSWVLLDTTVSEGPLTRRPRLRFWMFLVGKEELKQQRRLFTIKFLEELKLEDGPKTGRRPQGTAVVQRTGKVSGANRACLIQYWSENNLRRL